MRVVIVRVIVDGVLGVTIVVHIGHDEVLVNVVIYVAIFVVIFCNWRCTLYTQRRPPRSSRPFSKTTSNCPGRIDHSTRSNLDSS